MLHQRDQLRQCFFTAWEKFQAQQILSPLEKNIVTVLQQHPEYLPLFNNKNECLTQEFHTDNNPFLHLALHLSLQEQLTTHRPVGINDIYQQLLHHYQDQHLVEHKMMDVMAHLLWEAQQAGHLPNEAIYLERLRTMTRCHPERSEGSRELKQ